MISTGPASRRGKAGARARRGVALVGLLLVGVAAVAFASVASAEDGAPGLTSIQLSPSVVDVTNGPAEITVDVEVGESITALELGWRAPTTEQVVSVLAWEDELESGFELELPQHAATGIWELSHVTVYDADGGGFFSERGDELWKFGFELPSFEVIGVEDTTPPTVTAVSLDPAVVDVTDAPATLTMVIDAEDDLSGPRGDYSISWFSESGQQRLDEWGTFGEPSMFTVPRYAEAGVWKALTILAFDNAGNMTDLYGEADFINHGIAQPTFEVTGVSDTEPPVVLSVEVHPEVVNVAEGATTVQVQWNVTDDLSGVVYVDARWAHPSGDRAGDIVELTDNGFVQSVPFDERSETGVWTLAFIEVRDNAGNVAVFEARDGFAGLDIELPTIEVRYDQFCDDKLVTIDMNTNGGSGLGTDGDDVILGTPGDDRIFALGGNDTVCAGAGRDRVRGGLGDDSIFGGSEIDRLWGDDGADVIHGEGGSDRIYAGPGADTVYAGSGADRVFGGDGDDFLYGMGGQDFMYGEQGNDDLQGNWQSDHLWGGVGNDTLRGAQGKDKIYGEDGDDILFGGANTDYLDGGAGNDVANGQRGIDNPVVTDVSGCIAETKQSC